MSVRLDRRAAGGSLPEAAGLCVETRELNVTGRVQGVGFRPFVRRLAEAHGLAGWVCNRAGAVAILVQGEPAAIARFTAELTVKAPP
ncbi:MAG: acylphosphatase, partial [Rhodospirillales bacterium]